MHRARHDPAEGPAREARHAHSTPKLASVIPAISVRRTPRLSCERPVPAEGRARGVPLRRVDPWGRSEGDRQLQALVRRHLHLSHDLVRRDWYCIVKGDDSWMLWPLFVVRVAFQHGEAPFADEQHTACAMLELSQPN